MRTSISVLASVGIAAALLGAMDPKAPAPRPHTASPKKPVEVERPSPAVVLKGLTGRAMVETDRLLSQHDQIEKQSASCAVTIRHSNSRLD